MNSTSSQTAVVQQLRHGVYFFLSYAHSAPTSGRLGSDADPSVGGFFQDLVREVTDRATPAPGMEIGFFDQQIPPDADMKAVLSEALGYAEVFVPLYSPGYLTKSWPMREQAVFRGRLRVASAIRPDQHIVPILWTPVRSLEQSPEVARALRIGAGNSDYVENGMRALRMLTSYRQSYEQVLSRLADEIVTVAERFPLGPSAAPELDDVPGATSEQPDFLVAMLAPRKVGGDSLWWRTYAGRKIPPVAEHAGSVVERLDFNARVADFVKLEKSFDRTPAIVIVDPETVVERGSHFLTSIFAALPEWVIPVVLDDQQGPGAVMTDAALAALAAAGQPPINRVTSMDQLDEILPAVVARARRTYLKKGTVFPPTGPSIRPPRLREGDR